MAGKTAHMQWHVDLWSSIGGQRFADQPRIALLLAVAQTGSITAAARHLQISYKTAWDALAAMENLVGTSLITRSSGGRAGGGSHLTESGQGLLNEYERLITAQVNLLQRHVRQQNRLPVEVLGCQAGEVRVQTGAGHTLVGLTDARQAFAPGQRLEACVAPHDIIILQGNSAGQFSARNRLPGVVQQLLPGALEMLVEGDLTLRAAITAGSCEELALQPGSQVVALFKASSLLLDSGNVAGH